MLAVQRLLWPGDAAATRTYSLQRVTDVCFPRCGVLRRWPRHAFPHCHISAATTACAGELECRQLVETPGHVHKLPPGHRPELQRSRHRDERELCANSRGQDERLDAIEEGVGH